MNLGSWSKVPLLLAFVGLSACVSDALPRDDEDDDRRDAAADARDAGPGDARIDAVDGRTDTGPAVDVASDTNETGGTDATADVVPTDASADASDARLDVVDGGSHSVFIDSPTDTGADTGRDVVDAASPPSDAVDTATPPDVNEGGPAADANDASIDVSADGASNDGAADSATDTGSNDASDGGSADVAPDSADARSDATDGSDGSDGNGATVFFEETFDSALGSFTTPVAVCGVAIPAWSNASGYAHASEPSSYGVSRIASPVVTVPANLSNVTLRMSHKFDTEQGWDYAQLLIAKNGGAATLVTTFVSGGYIFGGGINGDTCQVANSAGQYQGWSGLRAEMLSVVNLSAAPFSVVSGDTVQITLRMGSDSTTGGSGWDVNWVTLSGSP